MGDDRPPARPEDWMTAAEQEWAEIMRLYTVHKVRGSLGTFYEMYPDLKPPPPLQDYTRDSKGRER